MTNNEAIQELNECYLIQSDEEGRRRNEAVTMAIEALEKQIPKKPYQAHIKLVGGKKLNTFNVCPICDDVLMTGYPCKCGQAIDWSDEND